MIHRKATKEKEKENNDNNNRNNEKKRGGYRVASTSLRSCHRDFLGDGEEKRNIRHSNVVTTTVNTQYTGLSHDILFLSIEVEF